MRIFNFVPISYKRSSIEYKYFSRGIRQDRTLYGEHFFSRWIKRSAMNNSGGLLQIKSIWISRYYSNPNLFGFPWGYEGESF